MDQSDDCVQETQALLRAGEPETKKSIFPCSSTHCSPGSRGSTNCPAQQHTKRSDQHCFVSELWSKMFEMAPLGVILHKMSRPGMDMTSPFQPAASRRLGAAREISVSEGAADFNTAN